jgi:hypothetical protein
MTGMKTCGTCRNFTPSHDAGVFEQPNALGRTGLCLTFNPDTRVPFRRDRGDWMPACDKYKARPK